MRAPWAVLVLCLTGAVVTVLLTVPFPVLPGAHPQVDVLRDFTREQLAREDAFHAAVRPPAYLSLGVSIGLAALLGLTGLGSRVVGAVPGHWVVKVLGGTAALLLLGRLATLPLDVLAERALRRYGLSTQSWVTWTDDLLRGLLIQVVVTSIVLVSLLGLARRFPAGWWLPGALLAAGFTLVGSFLYPVLIEPAFNSFTPLPAGQLRTDLLALADKDGVQVSDVLVADASKRTTALNAYVSGYGSTRRIVVFDTLLTEASDKEVELVVAHELGHAKRNDVLNGTVIGAFGAAAAVIAVFLLMSWSGLLSRIGALDAADPRAIPFLLLLATATPLLLAPLTNLVSRNVESRADLHSLELTGDLDTYITSEQRLGTTNLSDLDPHPLVRAFFFTHPAAPERIALAREWERLHR